MAACWDVLHASYQVHQPGMYGGDTKPEERQQVGTLEGRAGTGPKITPRPGEPADEQRVLGRGREEHGAQGHAPLQERAERVARRAGERDGEDVDLTPEFEAHLQELWIPYAADVIDSLLKWGYAVSVYEEDNDSEAEEGEGSFDRIHYEDFLLALSRLDARKVAPLRSARAFASMRLDTFGRASIRSLYALACSLTQLLQTRIQLAMLEDARGRLSEAALETFVQESIPRLGKLRDHVHLQPGHHRWYGGQ